MRIKTSLGKIGLDARQESRLHQIKNDLFLDFDTIGDEVFVYSTRSLNKDEIESLESKLKGLSKDLLDREIEETSVKENPLLHMTFEEFEEWIDGNVININDVRSALKLIGKLAVYSNRKNRGGF